MQLFGEGRDLQVLRERATALAAAWGATAATTTTVGQERAILRLFGVSGLDRAGRPIAAEVVERYLAADPRRLGGGIALPFAMAMAEYDLAPMDLALEVAAGNVDLGLEAELLGEPDRRAAAIAGATRLALAALDRVDANRTARRELLALLGERERPWLGVVLAAPAIVDALDEAVAAIEAGAGLLRVDVPPSRELAEQMARTGSRLDLWHAGPASRGGLDAHDPTGQPVPTGSQRALSVLRRVVDEAAARRRGYVRLVDRLPGPGRAGPGGRRRVRAARPRDRGSHPGDRDRSRRPDRALSDHVFAHRLLARAGTRMLVPAGPLLVAPDLATGVPSGRRDPVRPGPRPPAPRGRAGAPRRPGSGVRLRQRDAGLDRGGAGLARPSRRGDRAPARAPSRAIPWPSSSRRSRPMPCSAGTRSWLPCCRTRTRWRSSAGRRRARRHGDAQDAPPRSPPACAPRASRRS